MIDESKMIILGSGGQLGKALVRRFPQARALNSADLDITNKQKLDAFPWSDYRVLLNAAAYTNVDGAETPEGRKIAWAVNATGAAHLARIANQYDLTYVHVSTDYVFDGSQAMHNEEEPFSPLGVYGQAKAAGDIAVSLTSKHYNLRVSWVIGEGKNFVQIMKTLGSRNISPTVVSDQFGRLTFTTEIVRAIEHLLNNSSPYGTYNVSNDGEAVNWSDLTREIFKISGYTTLHVTDTTTELYYADKPTTASRPLHSMLALNKLQATGFISNNWHDDLIRYLKEEQL